MKAATISKSSGAPTNKRRLIDVLSDIGTIDSSSPKTTESGAKRAKKTDKSSVFVTNNDPVLVVSTSDSEYKKTLLQEVKSSLNPMSDLVKSVKCSATGKIVIHCNTKEDISDLKTKPERNCTLNSF